MEVGEYYHGCHESLGDEHGTKGHVRTRDSRCKSLTDKANQGVLLCRRNVHVRIAAQTSMHPKSTSHNSLNAKDVAFMAAVAAVLTASTVIVSPKHPLWYDEIFSWTLVTDPSFRHMLSALGQAAESPPGLYHTSARLWLAVTGPSILALRLFSTFAMVVALVVTWVTLRRAFSFHATGLAVVTVFCTSGLMMDHTSEARFYGLFVACVAIAIAAYAQTVTADRLTWKLALGLFLANLALVQSHVYGVAYSGALLLALIGCDLAARRVRLGVYSCVAIPWLSLAPWIHAFRLINEQTKPRHWITPPTFYAVAEFYRLYSTELPMVLFAAAILCLLARFAYAAQNGAPRARAITLAVLACITVAALLTPSYPTLLQIDLVAILIALAARGVPVDPSTSSRLRTALLVAGGMLLTGPVAAGIFSVLVKPVYIPRYVLPSALGVVILLTGIFEAGSRIPLRGAISTAISTGWLGMMVVMSLMPVVAAKRENSIQPPMHGISSASVEPFVPEGMPVAVESYFLFLPMQHQTAHPGRTYFYMPDLQSALDPKSDAREIVGYRSEELWKSLGYLPRERAPEWHQFLASHSEFVVLHSPGNFWFDWHIRSNPAYTWSRIGVTSGNEVILVRRSGASQVAQEVGH